MKKLATITCGVLMLAGLWLVPDAFQRAVPGGLLAAAAWAAWRFTARRQPVHGRPPRVLFLDQTGHLGGAELMLLDIAAGRAADSEVILFQDGEFRTVLEAAGVRTSVVTLAPEASLISKHAGLWQTLRTAPLLLRMIFKIGCAARSFDVITPTPPSP